jgi:hypothetical protein
MREVDARQLERMSNSYTGEIVEGIRREAHGADGIAAAMYPVRAI